MCDGGNSFAFSQDDCSMTHLKILIADDEAPARQKLLNFLAEENPPAHVMEAADGDEAVKKIRSEQPDLVLLDIQMPGKTGFEVIETIGVEHMPEVIFVTAYDEFALQAFIVQAVDYLLKPFDRERFQKALHRAMEQIRLKNSQSEILEKLLGEVRQKQTYLDRLMVSVGNRYVLLPVSEILYLQADDKYVEIHTSDKKHLLRETLTDLEAKLDPTRFARIHRSCIVNLDAIRQLTPRSHGDYWVELTNGERLVMSRRYREQVFR